MNKLNYFLFALFFIVPCMICAQEGSSHFNVKISAAGTGSQAMILLPGFACSGDLWDETVSYYQSRYKCYSFTMRGFAGLPPESAPTITGWVRGIADYIKANHIQKPIVIGHSLGGVMALMLASQYPDLVYKVTVVDALPCLNAFMNPAFKVQDTPECDDVVNRMVKMSDSSFYQLERVTIPRLVADTTYQQRIIDWGVHSDRGTYAAIYCQFGNTDLRDKIQSIKCPVLVLLEAPFKGMSSAVLDQYKKLSAAHFEYALKGLHFVMYDDKNWYFQQLDSFL